MEAAAVAIGTAFLNSAVDLLVQKLGSPQVLNFFKQQKVDKGLPKMLADTLNALNGLLSDAEEKQVAVPGVKNWHDDVKDAVYEAEDLLYEIDLETQGMNLVAGSQTCTDLVLGFFKYLNPCTIKVKNDIAEELKQIFQRLEHLENKAHTLQLIRLSGERQLSQSVPTTSRLGCSRVYGRDEAKRDIIELLLSDEARRKSLEVIPIVGMGGVGKTTLAKFVYNDSQVQEWFDLKAWVYVSKEFDLLKLTKDVLKGVGLLGCDSMTPDQLHCELENKLMSKKLLLVLDDFWNAEQAVWDFLLTPLMAAAEGSKIVVTMRNRSVASVVQSIQPYILPGISDDDCWLLFSEYAFGGENCDTVSEFEELFRSKVVRRCDGLPLAARSLGGLLRPKRDVSGWKEILKSNMWDLRNDENLPVLRVSYYYLPSYLKQCFAYCAILPKGYLFKKEELVLLWMAEGFLVHYDGTQEMKEAGYNYFQDLVSRSFFEQVNAHSSYFIMHDLINDLAKFVSGEFSACLDDAESCKISGKIRHLSYARTQYEDLKNLVGRVEVQNLRTILSLSKFFLAGMNNEEIDNLLRRFKRLRVLSLSPVHELPVSIGNLKHLYYLNLSGASVQKLPETVCTLQNLQILILRGCKNLIELPTNMMKLTKLYHLDVKGTILQQMPPQMGKLARLQTLTDFFVGEQSGSNIKELGELKYIQGKLCIWKLQNVVDVQDALVANLRGMKNLNKLSLSWSGESSDSPHGQGVLEQLRPHVTVDRLSIGGYGGEKFPAWLVESTLTDLRLSNCKYCHIFPSLGQLASLKKLTIQELDAVTVVGPEFYGSSASTKNPFKSLESLTFERMPQWCEWVPGFAEDGGFWAFPRLQELIIRKCPMLKKALPSHLPALRELQITECPQLVLSLPRSPTIDKMMLRDYSRDDLHAVKLEKLSSGLYSLAVDAFHSLDLLLQQMEQLGCPPASLEEINMNGGSIRFFPLKFFPKLKQLDIRRCRNLESLCASEEGSSTSSGSLKTCECLNLENLSLFDCSNLKSVDCSLPSLVELKISSCEELETFPAVGLSSSPGVDLSPKLESIEIHHCKKIFALREQWDCYRLPSLSRLEFRGIQRS